jgi:hypothetical protein
MATATKTVVRALQKENAPAPAPARRVELDMDQMSAEDAAELTVKFGELRAAAFNVEASATGLRFSLKCPNRLLNLANLRSRAGQLEAAAEALRRAVNALP